VTRIVETKVEAGSCVVNTRVDPGNVVTTVWPGSVTVEEIKLVTVLAANCVVNVEVRPGSVIVESTVEPGNCDVTMLVTAGMVIVESTVLAGFCVACIEDRNQRVYLLGFKVRSYNSQSDHRCHWR
jgi:hypothetical protein